ncbi:pantoate--beta-alanine ligase [Moraxella macacae 0408225]|uniref:Pantothenate synthetase n=1 Tax=Moraxella macacae 0408225 TaxID=1230338 RepID=L2FA05_9GAMM|nr:pantoate--beta-alanine ligase [Moraxella macacae]ELA09303.1 pantoate--beta-alanine ligase [Moraxella macacae 0408225]
MQIIHTIQKLQDVLKPHRQQKIALVPTMGNLHDGHLQLVKTAKQHADIVVVSIFVNPTQFGVGEDFDTYPRTLTQDCEKLQHIGTDFVFSPSVDEMYPNFHEHPPKTQVIAGDIAKILCAKSRPTHFDGVGLVVTKLFNIVRPDVAVFGKKDYQQLAIIRQINQDLNFGIDIIGMEIVRADDGLALSSRNSYLTETERKIAPMLQQTLQALKAKLINDAELNLQKLDDYRNQSIALLNSQGFKVDYLDIYTQNLDELNSGHLNSGHLNTNLVIVAAAWLGKKARLLDNIEINLNQFKPTKN